MLKPGTILDITDHTVEVLDNPGELGDRYRVRIIAQPGAPGIDGDFPHIHPNLIETFTCVTGHMTVRVGKQKQTVPEGKTAVAPQGQVHGFVNTGESPLIVDGEVIFPDGYRAEDDLLIFGAVYERLKRDSQVNSKTGEPPTLQMAVLAHAYREVLVQPGVVGLILPALAAIGRLRGYRADLPKFGT